MIRAAIDANVATPAVATAVVTPSVGALSSTAATAACGAPPATLIVRMRSVPVALPTWKIEYALTWAAAVVGTSGEMLRLLVALVPGPTPGDPRVLVLFLPMPFLRGAKSPSMLTSGHHGSCKH